MFLSFLSLLGIVLLDLMCERIVHFEKSVGWRLLGKR